MAAHVADITAVSSCKTGRGTSCCQHPVDLIDKKRRPDNLIIKGSPCFSFLFVFINVLKCVAVGSVSKSPLKKCFHFVSLQTQLSHNVSAHEVKTNTRQQLLVKHLEEGRLCLLRPLKWDCEISMGSSASVFILEKTKGKLLLKAIIMIIPRRSSTCQNGNSIVLDIPVESHWGTSLSQRWSFMPLNAIKLSTIMSDIR